MFNKNPYRFIIPIADQAQEFIVDIFSLEDNEEVIEDRKKSKKKKKKRKKWAY